MAQADDIETEQRYYLQYSANNSGKQAVDKLPTYQSIIRNIIKPRFVNS